MVPSVVARIGGIMRFVEWGSILEVKRSIVVRRGS
jgi:hypothetical protein